MFRPFAPVLALLSTLLATAPGLAASHPPRAVSGGYASRPVTTADGTTLETLDWGGTGPALVFLAGLGHTAHVYEDFAPRFRDRFRVIGVTRRGFGASSAPRTSGDLRLLAEDVLTVLDAYGLPSAVFVGHSIAGEELSWLAAHASDRCDALVYLDAAYDRARLNAVFGDTPPPPPPAMAGRDSASLAAVAAYLARATGDAPPRAELEAILRFDATGRWVARVTPDSLAARVLAAALPFEPARITRPALALYAVPTDAGELVPYLDALDAPARERTRRLFDAWSASARASRAAFAREAGHRVVEVRGGRHALFLQRPAEVERAMRDFLSDVLDRTAGPLSRR